MYWNSCANFPITVGEGHLKNFRSKIDFTAALNWKTASWLVDRPILYKSAILCIELHVASLDMNTATFTWTGTASRMFVSFLCMAGASVLHKYSNVNTSMRIRPLNSRVLNEPKRFWSKNPGRCKPLSWAHKHLGRGARCVMYLCNATAT